MKKSMYINESIPVAIYFSSLFSISFHYLTCLSSLLSIYFHYSTYFSSVFSIFFHYKTSSTGGRRETITRSPQQERDSNYNVQPIFSLNPHLDENNNNEVDPIYEFDIELRLPLVSSNCSCINGFKYLQLQNGIE